MRTRQEAHTALSNALTIRRIGEDERDREALARLAGRDSHQPLEGPVLVAEVEGKILAAISLADGELIADPFSRTAELRSLLELRAGQLRRRSVRTRHTARSRRPAPSSGALAGSPPGAGGRLLDLRSL